MQDQNIIRELARKYLEGTATEEEKSILHEWYNSVNAGDTEMVLTETDTDDTDTAAFGRQMLAEIKQKMTIERRFPWYRMAAAAIIVLLLGAATWQLLLKNNPQPQVAATKFGNDVSAPQSTRAVLTLADGTKILLDSAGKGSLAVQGDIQITKSGDGQIGYTATKTDESTAEEVGFNTLTIPYGSKPMNLSLSDGSRVWLDAGTTITYPTAFREKERRVEINGQAYFEVAHNPRQPFIVTKADLAIQVLGTHFNVNAYDDEERGRITLLEGSVKVNRNTASVQLVPGQQAEVGSRINVNKDVDLEEVMAWKNGRFELNGSTIEPIMRQVARWYDVEVEYRGAHPPDNFMGSVSRQENVSELLKILEHTQAVQFTIEGKKIIVMKK